MSKPAASSAKRRHRRYCCVVNCHEQEGLNPGVSFYRFPSKPHEVEQRERWIRAAQRTEPDGKPWQPTQNSRMCSRHFVGNKKSNCVGHPAYVPTIFPPAYKRPLPLDSSSGLERFDRWRKRLQKAPAVPALHSEPSTSGTAATTPVTVATSGTAATTSVTAVASSTAITTSSTAPTASSTAPSPVSTSVPPTSSPTCQPTSSAENHNISGPADQEGEWSSMDIEEDQLIDKGFPGIRASLADRGVILVMPPFSAGSNVPFTTEEMEETYAVASVRIHVERMIQRIKLYDILNHRVPISLIPAMGDIFHMCCVLANLQPHIISS
ncbi:uncharacterized protein ISCGN_011486 [Ixodes scapularis]